MYFLKFINILFALIFKKILNYSYVIPLRKIILLKISFTLDIERYIYI